MTDDRLERLAKLRALVAAHHCESCEADDPSHPCSWMARAATAIATVEAQGQEEAVPPPSEPPKNKGRGRQCAPGMPRRIWRPISRRNRKKLYKNREAWPRFRDTAGIDKRITFASAYKRAKCHQYTLAHIINGMTDTRFSTVLDICQNLGCTLNGFAKAIKQAWEIAERRARADEAIQEATLDRTEVES